MKTDFLNDFLIDREKNDVLEEIAYSYCGKLEKRPYSFKKNNNFGDNITYVTNSFFSRSQNSTENVKILTIGCSQTFGLGIQYSKNIWPIILSKKMNLKCMNLAEPGDNIFGQIIKANKYIKNYEKPLYIFALFPPLKRFIILKSKNLKTDNEHVKTEKIISMSYDVKKSQNISKISKSPYLAEDVIPENLRFFYNIQSIMFFEEFCKSNNIKLIWGFWDKESETFINELKEIYNDSFLNFIELNIEDNWKPNFKTGENIYLSENCHSDKKNLKDFHFGLDRQLDGLKTAHMGVHQHIHIAENFYSNILSKE